MLNIETKVTMVGFRMRPRTERDDTSCSVIIDLNESDGKGNECGTSGEDMQSPNTVCTFSEEDNKKNHIYKQQ
jgi:hypothetical protein